MTAQEFDKLAYGAGDKVVYKGKIYDVYSVDFEERLFGINFFGKSDTELEAQGFDWIRCENVVFMPKPVHP